MHYFNHEFVSWPIHALAWDGSLTGHRQNGSFSAIDIEHVRDIVMSPKKVIYYYASYEADRNRGVRHVTDMYRDKDHVHKMPLDGLSPIFHEIEIEE